MYAFFELIKHKTPAQLQAEKIDIEKKAMEIIKRNLLLEILLPAFWRILQISYQNKADASATLTIIAILRYVQDKGHHPDSLEDLITAGYLNNAPTDPFSDEPLVYRKTDDDFLLYSFGPNFRDDGGKMAYNRKAKPQWRGTEKEGDAVFWPVAK